MLLLIIAPVNLLRFSTKNPLKRAYRQNMPLLLQREVETWRISLPNGCRNVVTRGGLSISDYFGYVQLI